MRTLASILKSRLKVRPFKFQLPTNTTTCVYADIPTPPDEAWYLHYMKFGMEGSDPSTPLNPVGTDVTMTLQLAQYNETEGQSAPDALLSNLDDNLLAGQSLTVEVDAHHFGGDPQHMDIFQPFALRKMRALLTASADLVAISSPSNYVWGKIFYEPISANIKSELIGDRKLRDL